jgi:hypothetical protein
MCVITLSLVPLYFLSITLLHWNNCQHIYVLLSLLKYVMYYKMSNLRLRLIHLFHKDIVHF